MLHWLVVGLLITSRLGKCHGHSHQHKTFTADELNELERKWGNDWAFTGISTFAHLPHVKCLTRPSDYYDIGVIGTPFDTAVSYRPGARFGPRAIRAASARQTPLRGFNPRARFNPYTSWAAILDCGDIPVSPFDNGLGLRQMTEAYKLLAGRQAPANSSASGSTYRRTPKLVSLGGDHSIALPALRALTEHYGQPITMIHFDAHLDTWHPAAYPSAWVDLASLDKLSPDNPRWTEQSFFTHGNMFYLAHIEGLIRPNTSVHAGLRTRLSGVQDEEEDTEQGWSRIESDAVAPENLGVAGVAQAIIERVTGGKGPGLHDQPVYLSIDIDVIDPGLAPATGTPEPGGWTTRELIGVLRRLEGLNVVGADVVEVSPAYDGPGEQTALAAAQVVYEVITNMVKRGILEEEWAASAEGEGAAGRDEL